MKILHTADLHLKDKEHLSIVKAIIRLAEQESVDLIIIAGDLFDASANGRILEAGLLPIWQEFGGSVLVVPGNHDDKFLRNRDELAPNVTVANQIPYSVAEIDGVYFVCVPYQKNQSLSDIEIPHYEPAVLITHGTFARKSSDQDSYFPILASDLAGRYRYVALGHYHTWFDKWVEGTLIVNPGAPRQTRKSDKGIRYISILDTNSWLMERVALPVSFKEFKTISLSVVDSEKEIRSKLLASTLLLEEHFQAEIVIKLQGTLLFTKYSLSERVDLWIDFLESKGIDSSRITWDLNQITQISSKVMYSSFTRLMVDKISDYVPKELDDLAPFLFERLQHENQRILD